MVNDPVALASVFIWSNRGNAFRIVFADGDEYVLASVVAGQDQGEPPHAVGNVVERIRGPEHVDGSSALFFHLSDIMKVTDEATGETVYEAA